MKRNVDADNPVVEYARKGAMWKMDASLIKNSDGTWKPDENKLVLYSAGQIVGTL